MEGYKLDASKEDDKKSCKGDENWMVFRSIFFDNPEVSDNSK